MTWHSKWLTAQMCVWEEPGTPTDKTDKSPSVSFVSAPPAGSVHTHVPPRRCVFCAAELPAEPDTRHAAGDMRRCRRCGGEDYDPPAWIAELTARALEANRRRAVPGELSKPFSAAVLGGNEAEARAALTRIEGWARGETER